MNSAHDIDPRNRIRLYIPLILQRLSSGDLFEAADLINQYRNIAQTMELPPLALLTLKNFEASYSWRSGEGEKCLSIANEAISLGKDHGIHVLTPLLLLNGALGGLSGGNLKSVPVFLTSITPYLNEAGVYVKVVYHVIFSWYCLLSKEHSKALFHAEHATRFGENAGNPELLAVANLANAFSHHANNNQEDAVRWLNRAFAIVQCGEVHQVLYACHITAAEFALKRGDQKSGLESLRRGLALGEEKNYRNFFGWRTGVVQQLCQIALEHRIEVEYVRDLIRVRGLVPHNQKKAILIDWPWKYRFYCLRDFRIIREDKILNPAGKSQLKPLALLKIILAQGGRSVSQDLVESQLWPDSDGDMQNQVFNTTLHRLRKLLGTKDIVTLNSRVLALNANLCWVDAWIFENILSSFSPLNKDLDVSNLEPLSSAMGLYEQSFLAHEEEGWVFSYRDKLENTLSQTILHLGQKLSEANREEESIFWYNRGIEKIPHNESLYYQLMLCYLHLGKNTETVETYRRCSKVLDAKLQTTPSQQIEEVYQKARKALR